MPAGTLRLQSAARLVPTATSTGPGFSPKETRSCCLRPSIFASSTPQGCWGGPARRGGFGGKDSATFKLLVKYTAQE